jgi:hypothetical protein
MRKRIKTRVVVSDAITEMDERSNKRKEWFNTIILPIARKYTEQGLDWAKAKKFALAEYGIQQSFANINQSYGTVGSCS